MNKKMRIFQNGLQFYDMCEVNGFLYASSLNMNALIRIHVLTGEADWVTQFQNEEPLKKNMHRQVIKRKNQLLFIPSSGQNIHIYSLDDKRQRCIKIFEKTKEIKYCYVRAFNRENDVLLVPNNQFVPLTYLDLNTYQVFYDNNFWKKIISITKIVNPQIGAYGVEYVHGQLWIGVWNSNKICCYSLKNKTIEIYFLPEKVQIRNILLDENSIWITQMHSYEVLKFDCNSCQIQSYYPEKSGDFSSPFFTVQCMGGDFVVLGGDEPDCFLIDTTRHLIKPMNILSRTKLKKTLPLTMFFGGFNYGDEYILFPRSCDGILFINRCNKKISEKKISYSDALTKQYILQIDKKIFDAVKNINAIEESDNFIFYRWLDKVVFQLHNCEKYSSNRGKAIYEQMSEKMFN